MKKDKSQKFEQINFNIFEKITSYLDYHSIHELYYSSKKISQKLKEVEIINTLDLRQMNIEGKISFIQRIKSNKSSRNLDLSLIKLDWNSRISGRILLIFSQII
jgi:hypothetical protein